jgi:hypothetical protein
MDNLSTVAYEDGRKLIQDGDVVFVANKRGILLPLLIRFFTKSIYSHTAIAFWIDTPAGKRLMAVQAQGGNKRFVMNLSALDKCDLHIVTSPKAWTDVAPLALVKLDKVPYSFIEAMYVGLREFLMKYFHIKIKERDFCGEICSEFNARVLGLADTNISPEGLYEELMKTQQVRIVLSN